MDKMEPRRAQSTAEWDGVERRAQPAAPAVRPDGAPRWRAMRRMIGTTVVGVLTKLGAEALLSAAGWIATHLEIHWE
ncbi:hypothetical protein GCM10010440_70680 [Kitasatospora cinereorecta]